MAKLQVGDVLRFRREENGAIIPDGAGEIEGRIISVDTREAIEPTEEYPDGEAEFTSVRVAMQGVGEVSLPADEAALGIPLPSMEIVKIEIKEAPPATDAPVNDSPGKDQPGKPPLGS